MEKDVFKVIGHELGDAIFELERMKSKLHVPIYPGDMLMHVYISRMFLSMNEV